MKIMAIKICLDAGHFGKYNRSNVYPAYYESDMAWKLHLLLKTELEKYGFEVITTRKNKDVDLALNTRGAMSKGCDLLISLHSNACTTESVDRAVIIPFQDIGWTTIDDKSREIAQRLGACVRDTMGLSSYQIYPRRAEYDRDGNGEVDDEYYGVLYGARKVGTPGIIIEHGFHTNTKCAKWLSDDSNLEKLAKAEAKVITEYFGVNKAKEWYADAQSWVVENGIADGTRPNDLATRAEIWTMLQRLYNLISK
jgi:N-acetylmuramoyl-L-alanine amidase